MLMLCATTSTKFPETITAHRCSSSTTVAEQHALLFIISIVLFRFVFQLLYPSAHSFLGFVIHLLKSKTNIMPQRKMVVVNYSYLVVFTCSKWLDLCCIWNGIKTSSKLCCLCVGLNIKLLSSTKNKKPSGLLFNFSKHQFRSTVDLGRR